MKRSLLLAMFVFGISCSTSAPPPAPRAGEAPPQTETGSRAMYVTATSLNVRSEPSTQAKVLTRVARGEKVQVLTTPASASWSLVETASGYTGYVASQHLASSPPGAAPARRRRAGCAADSEYRFVKTPMPSFSDSGAHGLVVVEANVDASGVVRSTRVVSNSTGDDALGALAQREIREARFAAPVRDCAPRAFIFTYKRSF